jgi:large subunit ribosomal protein L21
MNYAIVEIGGAQHRVSPGDRILVQRVQAGGDGKLALDRVLLIQSGDGVMVGDPYVSGATVAATVLGETKDRKVIVFKKKRRKQYRRTRGHRQIYTSLQIGEIRPGG